jgi:hypothetical protein
MRSLRQLKDLINNLAKRKHIHPQILLRFYMMERLLERIASSLYKESFILKGGMFVSSLIGVESRSTVDMDTTLKQRTVTMESIKKMFDEIILIDMDDGVIFDVNKVEEIREETDYLGFRVSLDANLEHARIPIKVDVTTGDMITPKELHYHYPLLLEDRSIEILSYNIETVIAEKMETIITRGTANTRMRDFYDIHTLYHLQFERMDFHILKQAILATANRRGTITVLQNGGEVIEEVLISQLMSNKWETYRKKFLYASNISWEQIGDSVRHIWELIDLD